MNGGSIFVECEFSSIAWGEGDGVGVGLEVGRGSASPEARKDEVWREIQPFHTENDVWKFLDIVCCNVRISLERFSS